MTNILNIVNKGDLVNLPAFKITDAPVVAYGGNPEFGNWIVVNGGNQGDIFIHERDLQDIEVTKFNSMPRNTAFIKWVVHNQEDYSVQFAASYGHPGNHVWEYNGKRIMADKLMEHILEHSMSDLVLEPLIPLSSLD